MLFDADYDINISINNNFKESTLNSPKLVNEQVGLIRGNMFLNDYIPYKNMQPQNIVPKTTKDTLMLKLYETDFALHDLNLYLDLHPNDNYMYEIFKNYVASFNDYKAKYEKEYGPLDLEDATASTYKWSDNPWPWDKDGGTMYV
jgi:hypothetical protein